MLSLLHRKLGGKKEEKKEKKKKKRNKLRENAVVV